LLSPPLAAKAGDVTANGNQAPAIYADLAQEPVLARRPAFSHPINHMRGLAILPIVAGHCYNALDWPPGSVGAHLTAVWADLNAFFIFISGYLFQHLLGRFVYARYLKAKLRNVILPYLVMSVPALLLYAGNWKIHPHFGALIASLPVGARLTLLLLTGAQMGPYWFIPMMAIFYLASPLLVLLDRRPAWYVVLVPLFLCSITLVPRPLYDLQPLQSALHYLPVYLLGMFVSHFHERVVPVLRRCWLALAAISALLLMVIVYADYAAIRFDRLPIATLLCLAVLALLSRFTAQRVAGLDLLARYSFGIFFVHAYYVAAFRQAIVRWPGLAQGSALGFVLLLALVLALTMTTVWIVRRVAPGRSRMLIGS
jgi:peptidoglycan/LPS O-acetylase OafA/YrhL